MIEGRLYHYRFHVLRVVDGDTLEGECDVGFHLRQTMRLRLLGINAPELHSKDLGERDKAATARDELAAKVTGKDLVIRTKKTDAFGRYLALCFLDDENINEWLIRNGYAAPFHSDSI